MRPIDQFAREDHIDLFFCRAMPWRQIDSPDRVSSRCADCSRAFDIGRIDAFECKVFYFLERAFHFMAWRNRGRLWRSTDGRAST